MAAGLGKVRQGGRTAVITRTTLQYGLGRMAQIFGTDNRLPFELGIFRSRDEALAWLNAAEPPDTAEHVPPS
jgi:hypothetical protein